MAQITHAFEALERIGRLYDIEAAINGEPPRPPPVAVHGLLGERSTIPPARLGA
jgi:hypothetical protein